MNAPQTLAGFLSPSFANKNDQGGEAFEVKYLVDEGQAQRAEAWARERMTPDPHGDPELGGAYLTHSLYSDTPEMDVYFRRPSYKRRKYRVRRYGTANWVSLERKSRWGDRVAKRREVVPLEDLTRLTEAVVPAEWSGHWFHQRLARRRLQPACHIVYLRSAYAGFHEGAIRLTLDRNVRGRLQPDWSVGEAPDAIPLLAGQVILELKFRAVMPTPFKELVTELLLQPTSVSKYRRCREAWGLPAAQEREIADA